MKNKLVYIVIKGYDHHGEGVIDVFADKNDALILIEKLKKEELKNNPYYKDENPYFDIISKIIK